MTRGSSRPSWLLAIGAMMACGGTPAGGGTAEAWRSASFDVAVGSARFTLEAEAWRSFQPITATREGDPMIVVVRLASTATIADAVTIDAVQLMRGSEAWSGTAREESPRTAGATTFEAIVRNGPAWVPGDSIDVIAKVRLASGATTYLKAPRIAIARVD